MRNKDLICIGCSCDSIRLDSSSCSSAPAPMPKRVVPEFGPYVNRSKRPMGSLKTGSTISAARRFSLIQPVTVVTGSRRSIPRLTLRRDRSARLSPQANLLGLRPPDWHGSDRPNTNLPDLRPREYQDSPQPVLGYSGPRHNAAVHPCWH